MRRERQISYYPCTLGATVLFTLSAVFGCQGGTASPPATPVAPVAESTAPAESSLKQRLTAKGENSDSERAKAVEEAIEQYDQAARNGTTSDSARAFVDEYAAVLTQVTVESYGSLPPKVRLAVINLLVSFRIPATAPAFVVALDSFAKTKQDIESTIWAARGAAQTPTPELASSLLRVWQVLDMSDRDDRRFSAHLASALRANARPEWAPFLTRALAQPLDKPARFDDKPAVKAYQNQLFWQSTAAELLGQLKSAEHARVLFQVLLTPSKHEIFPGAELGLMKMGSATLPTLQGLLDGSDAELFALAAKAIKTPEPGIYFATRICDQLRLPESATALKRAWERVQDPVARTLLVRSLSLLPGSNVSAALKTTFLSTKLDTTLPEGDSALEVLADAAANSLERESADPQNLAVWMAERVPKVTGSNSRKGDVQRALVEAVSKLAFPSDIKPARKVAQLYGGRTGTPMFEQAAALLASCGEGLACYRARLAEPRSDAPEQAFTRVKATLMLAMLGGPSERSLIISKLQAPVDHEFLNAALRAVEQLTPSHDAVALMELQGAIDALPKDAAQEAQRGAMQRTLDRLNLR